MVRVIFVSVQFWRGFFLSRLVMSLQFQAIFVVFAMLLSAIAAPTFGGIYYSGGGHGGYHQSSYGHGGYGYSQGHSHGHGHHQGSHGHHQGSHGHNQGSNGM